MQAKVRFSATELEFLGEVAKRAARDNAREAGQIQSRLNLARKEALRLARLLSGLQELSLVIHFGSSANGRSFRLDSDIDLAIRGGDILEAMRVAETSVFHVDVIDIDTVPEPLKTAMLEEGVVLYENS
jgi:predicted nucleotidyltransferase